MGLSEDLAAAQSSAAATVAALTQAEADVNAPSVGDQVLAAIIPVLESAGYTVTPPAEVAADTSDDATSGEATAEPSA